MSVLADDSSVRDALEATCRLRMAELAQLPSRGWDSQRERDKLIAELDALLDDWASA